MAYEELNLQEVNRRIAARLEQIPSRRHYVGAFLVIVIVTLSVFYLVARNSGTI